VDRAVAREAPLTGGIRYNGPADTLMSLRGPVIQRVRPDRAWPPISRAGCPSPCLNGVVRGNALTYENQAYGTRLTQMALTGRFTGNRLEIETLTAKAGDGTVSAKGYVSLAADAGYPMDIAATVHQRAAWRAAMRCRPAPPATLRLTKRAGEAALLTRRSCGCPKRATRSCARARREVPEADRRALQAAARLLPACHRRRAGSAQRAGLFEA
jgi:translocation and assembly module TamB